MLNFKSRVMFCVALLGCSMSLYAALQPAATELHNLLAPVQSLKAHFKQTVYTERNKVIQTASGVMEFKRPTSFRWEVTHPDASLVVTNGDKLWNYDQDLEQVTIQKYTANNEVTPLSFLFADAAKLDQDFTIEKLTRKQNHSNCYKLTPKMENTSFVNVTVCFKSGHLQSLQLQDHLNQVSKFIFDHVQKNSNIADARFLFVAPTGVDVIGES